MTMTSEDVIDILGPVDETLIADVVATAASQRNWRKLSHESTMTKR